MLNSEWKQNQTPIGPHFTNSFSLVWKKPWFLFPLFQMFIYWPLLLCAFLPQNYLFLKNCFKKILFKRKQCLYRSTPMAANIGSVKSGNELQQSRGVHKKLNAKSKRKKKFIFLFVFVTKLQCIIFW